MKGLTEAIPIVREYNDKISSCSKNKGFCIFSKRLLKNRDHFEHLEDKADEKYHQKEFDLVREFTDLNVKKRARGGRREKEKG